MFSTSRVASAVALAMMLVGCGGGGGGGGSDDSETPAPVSTTTTQSVSGSVTLSSLVAAAAKSADASTAAVPQSATVTVHSYESDGTLTETKTVVAGSEGVFSSQVTLHNAGGYLVIDVKSPGTTGWSKRIEYSDPADVDINAQLRLAQTVVQNISDPLKASAEGGVFSFGVVRYVDGSRKAVAGGSAIAAAKAAEGAAGMDLEIAIPSAALPNTDTLRANLVTFDPNDAEDARSFPGDYLDSDGNRLVSVAFDSIEVTDEAGASVAELAQDALETGQAVKSADTTSVTVRRWIPYGSCASVDTFWNEIGPSGSENGNTIPIYTYNPNSGSWILLGDGTVQTYDSNAASYTDVAAFDLTNCEQGAYYLNIAVSSEEYINAWWNLDYPLLASQPTEVCVDVTFKDDATAANPLPGIYAELSGTGLSRVSGSTGANGVVRLNSVVTDGTPTTASVSYWNPFDYSYQTEAAVTVAAKDEGCATHNVTVAKPKICSVTGTVTKNGEAVADQHVWAYSANPYSYGSAYTGDDGSFEANVRCDVDMTLYVGNVTKSFRVDGAKAGDDEASDDGTVVALGTITKPNTPPYAYGYLSSYGVKASSTGGTVATAYVYGYDTDGSTDYPLSYTLSVGGTPYTGSIAQNEGFKSVPISVGEGTYAVSLTMTDQQGGQGSMSVGTLEVSPADANRAPVISYAFTSVGSLVRLNRDGTLPPISLYAYAYDPDGDALTANWSSSAGTLDASDTLSGATATAGDVLTFTYTVEDGNTAPVSRTVEVEVLAAANQSPYFSSVSQSATEVSTVPADIDFSVTAVDGDGDLIGYTWKVDGVEDTAATGAAYTVTVPATATDGDSITVTVEIDDGYVDTPPSRTFTVTYRTVSSDTEVILQ